MAFEQLESEDFWRALCPDLTVYGNCPSPLPVLQANDATMAMISGIFDREGYLHLPGTQHVALIERLAKLVQQLRDSGVPPVFAFVYEEMWEPYRRLGLVLDGLLGAPHAFMPDFWAWHIDPSAGEAGWIPHRDHLDELLPEQRPNSVTAWVPMTRATPLNGCMYVLPKQHDPLYGQAGAGVPPEIALPDIRAVPAGPGDTLIWTQALLHWGARSSELSSAPRMSMSLEIQRADVAPVSLFKMPLGYRMNLAQKLSLIGGGMDRYRHMHTFEPGMAEFAERWLGRLPDAFGVTIG
jgi:hypothetical protein